MISRSWLKRAAAVAGTILLTAVVGAAASLSVTVVDKDSGAPLAKAVVAVVAGDSVLAVGRTNAHGTWSGAVPDVATRITASKSLYASATSTALSPDGNHQVRLALPRHQAADFKRFGRIVGFIRNAQGQPLGNATLVLVKGATAVGCAQSENATGIYELGWYSPSTYSVLATAPGHHAAKYTGQKISAGESLWLDVKLQPK